jgi:hypothetical protein
VILQRLAEYTCDLRERPVADDVLHATKRAVVDWSAATIPGGLRPPATLLAAALSSELGAGAAMLIPHWSTAAPRTRSNSTTSTVTRSIIRARRPSPRLWPPRRIVMPAANCSSDR